MAYLVSKYVSKTAFGSDLNGTGFREQRHPVIGGI